MIDLKKLEKTIVKAVEKEISYCFEDGDMLNEAVQNAIYNALNGKDSVVAKFITKAVEAAVMDDKETMAKVVQSAIKKARCC